MKATDFNHGPKPLSGHDESPADDTLTRDLRALLLDHDSGRSTLEEDLPTLELRHGPETYSRLIYLLAQLLFDPADAERHWWRILERRNRMQAGLGEDVDLRVALVSHFIEVDRQMQNPRLVEMAVLEQTRASAYRDELTGLYNFRMFREHLAREVDRARRLNAPLSIAMIDIDHFKHYNDRNGHEAGNEVLAKVAHTLQSSVRGTDTAVRYGGEEFALVLPATAKTHAGQVAERARELVENLDIPHGEAQPGGQLTISLGVATFPADANDGGELVRCADKAMYLAKSAGRNHVRLYGDSNRSYRRCTTALQGRFQTLEAEPHALTAVTVGDGGLCFYTRTSLNVGAVVDVSLTLPNWGQAVACTGRVINVEAEDGLYRAAARILDMSGADRALLSQHITRHCNA